MASCSKKEPIAIINGDYIYMSDIEDDLTLMSAMENITKDDAEAYSALIYQVLNAYVMDYICNKEMEALGLKYKSSYYGASYESLTEAYGGDAKLIKFMKSIGLDREYVEDLCRRQAKQATLVEYFASTITMSDEELLTYYIENVDEFTFTDLRNLSSVYFSTKTEADAALTKINEIGFDAYYQLQETEPTTLYHIKFDHVDRGDFPTSTGDVIWAVEVGQFTDPIPCSVGYTIIKIDGIVDSHTYSFDEMKEAIEEILLDVKTDEYLEKYFEELKIKYKVEVFLEG